MITPMGGPLIAADFEALAARWIDRETAAQQFLRRVNALDGSAAIGRNGARDFAGLLIPNVRPGADYIREYRLRRDHPEMENGKAARKYMAPPGRGNLLYFPIGTDPEWLTDPQLPLVITEGEFKTIALARAARHDRQAAMPWFLAVGIPGVWNWRGTVGKTADAEGHRIDEKGTIPDLGRIVWDDRRVLILFDADLEENESVRLSRFLLTKVLRSRGAQVSWFTWPSDRPPQAKGIDDLLAAIGPEPVLRLIDAAFAVPAGPPDLIPFHFADAGNADRLVALYGADLRYCYARRKWMIWTGTHWAVDETGRALQFAKRTIVDFLRQAVETKNDAAQKFAGASLDSRRLQAMLLLAQPELPAVPADMDRDPSLLNFLNGTVDLRTSKLRSHRRSDLITRLVHHNYRAEAVCPHWLGFLSEIMGADGDAAEAGCDHADELIRFLQLALGYSITGEVSEKAVFVACGSGDNGKTTLLSVVRDLIHEYTATVGLDLLTTRDESNNVSAARAKLLGARFVTSSETEEGQRLSAARLKRICQGPGGEIEACRKYENPITFPETHKLWIDANHKPDLPASDAAVWNRLRLVPFTVTIPKDRQDRELTSKLLAEAEGILAWLVQGARQWYAEGLSASQIVAEATAAWREELDRLRTYLDEHTESVDPTDKDYAQAFLLNRLLYAAYRSWCEANGERALSQTKLNAQMEAMGYRKAHTRTGNVWRGLRFRELR
jgi:putative DNA primase/helicase